jgi:hypothetical protein
MDFNCNLIKKKWSSYHIQILLKEDLANLILERNAYSLWDLF